MGIQYLRIFKVRTAVMSFIVPEVTVVKRLIRIPEPAITIEPFLKCINADTDKRLEKMNIRMTNLLSP